VSRSTKESLHYNTAAKAAAVESLPDKHDIARRYKVTVRTVDRWTKDRLIPSIKFGPRCTRFKWADVEKAIERLTVKEVA
jgi:excisionase family DNA binding protein